MQGNTACYALLKIHREQLHLQVARPIKDQFSSLREAHPKVIARHWIGAGAIEPAIAATRNAFHEAHESHQQSLALLNLSPESAERSSRKMETLQSVFSMLNKVKGYKAHA